MWIEFDLSLGLVGHVCLAIRNQTLMKLLMLLLLLFKIWGASYSCSKGRDMVYII